jgi:hypothetical protein
LEDLHVWLLATTLPRVSAYSAGQKVSADQRKLAVNTKSGATEECSSMANIGVLQEELIAAAKDAHLPTARLDGNFTSSSTAH